MKAVQDSGWSAMRQERFPDMLKPDQARLIKAGSDIILEMHYTASGKEQTDLTKVGFVFAKEPPKERVVILAATTKKFVIPPGADNHKVEAELTLHDDTTISALTPHMHLRGKAFEYRVVYPTGETKELLRVPRYDFNWQLSYEPDEAHRSAERQPSALHCLVRQLSQQSAQS